jgi:hypothetical protein
MCSLLLVRAWSCATAHYGRPLARRCPYSARTFAVCEQNGPDVGVIDLDHGTTGVAIGLSAGFRPMWTADVPVRHRRVPGCAVP